MKIAIGKSGVFDSKCLVLQVSWRCEIQKGLLSFWATGLWFRGYYAFDPKLLSSFELCISIIIFPQFPAYWYSRLFLIIFFCPTTFLPTISAYWVELQPVTVASQSYTILALPRLLWTQASEHPCKGSEWLLLRVQQLQGPLSKSLHHWTFSYDWNLKLIFWLQNKWVDQNMNIYTLWYCIYYCVLKSRTEIHS